MQQNYLKELSRELSNRLQTAITIVQTNELISSKITLLSESHMRNVHRPEPRAVYTSLCQSSVVNTLKKEEHGHRDVNLSMQKKSATFSYSSTFLLTILRKR